MRLAPGIPACAHAARELAASTGTLVSAATGRRLTEAAGAADVAVQTAEAERRTRTAPAPPPGPPGPQLSGDGARGPLVGGEGAAVTTRVLGTRTGQASAAAVRATARSSCSRLADAATFTAAARVETHRRGTLPAGRVVAPQDGAVGQPGVLDVQRVDAVRILDVPHAGA